MVAEDGLTVITLPVPAAVPPQLVVYHCQEAPEPSVPPVTVSVALPPVQIEAAEVVAPVDAAEFPAALASSINRTAFELAVAGVDSYMALPPGFTVGNVALEVVNELNCLKPHPFDKVEGPIFTP